MYRLFVAIEIPTNIGIILHDHQKHIPNTHWTPTSQIHLTLQFIGEVNRRQLTSIKEKLSTVIFANFLLKINKFSFFKQQYQATLWVGIEDSNKLDELQLRIAKVLTPCFDIKNDIKKFLPHITIGKMRPFDDNSLQLFSCKDIEDRSITFTVKSFTLFESTLIPSGATHTVVERYYPNE